VTTTQLRFELDVNDSLASHYFYAFESWTMYLADPGEVVTIVPTNSLSLLVQVEQVFDQRARDGGCGTLWGASERRLDHNFQHTYPTVE
jgi:hypothetical protein